jgi:large subunit ribosomal protein L30
VTRLAIIRLRGIIRTEPKIKTTMKLLKLGRNNCCVVLPDNESTRGMAFRVKDYTTYGMIDDETYKLLLEKKPEGKDKGFFRLSPPRGGFERKGIKRHFADGGALGDRKDKINELIRRMI